MELSNILIKVLERVKITTELISILFKVWYKEKTARKAVYAIITLHYGGGSHYRQ